MITSHKGELLFANIEYKILYYTTGPIVCKSDDEFNKILLQEKKKIADRDYILNRFEPWEVNSSRQLKMLLTGRSRTKEEKDLVATYISYIDKEEN